MAEGKHPLFGSSTPIVFLLLLSIPALLHGQDDLERLEGRLAGATGRDKLEVLHQLTAACFELRDYESTLDYGRQAEELARTLNDKSGLALALRLQGDAHRHRNEYPPSLDRYHEAIPLSEEAGDLTELARTLYHTAVTYWLLSDHAKALEYTFRSYEVAGENNAPRAQAAALNMAGLVYNALEQHSKSLEYYLQVLELLEELSDERAVGRTLNNIGSAYRKQGDLDRALDYYKKSLAIKEKVGDEEKIPSTLNNLGTVYQRLGDPMNALSYFRRSLEGWEKIGDEREIAGTLSHLGDSYREQADFESAIEVLERCLAIAEGIGARSSVASCHYGLADVYADMGRFEEAFAAFRDYERLKVEVFSEENSRVIAELEARFEIDRKRKEIELLKQQQEIDELELAKQVNTRRALLASLTMTLVLLFVLLGRYRERARSTRTIEGKNLRLRKTLDELRESEQRYRRLFQDPAIGKIVLDPIEETILDVNEPARTLLGRRRSEDLTGTKIAELGCEWLARMLDKPPASNTDSRAVVETFEHVEDGEKHYYEAWVSPLHLSGRHAALLTLHDVTERRRLEEQRVRQEERERYITELEAGKAEVEARNAEMERFTYTVSHDLKGPLFTIRGFLGFLKRDAGRGDTDHVKTNIEHIDGAVTKMARLLDELLQLSRVGRVANPSQEVGMTDLAREVAETLSTLIDENGVTVEISPDLPPAVGDRQRLGEVLQNLIENAIKFRGDENQPRVEVSWRRQDDKPVYLVRDNGIGMDARYHEKVFGLFERLDASIDGSGIGLALVRRIVEVHGGRIWIESEGEGCGSTVCFTLQDPVAPRNGRLATAPVHRRRGGAHPG